MIDQFGIALLTKEGQKMRVLVTGGAGFIGSHIVERLVRDGEDVRVLDNLSTGLMDNLADALHSISFLRGDIRSQRDVENAVNGVDLVFHEAAVASVPQSIVDPKGAFEVNVIGTLNLLIAARDAGVRRLVFASSAAVYGNDPVSPKHEALRTDPLSPYAVSKVSGEQLCKVFNDLYGVETVSLRYFNVYGPRQDPASPYAAVIPLFLEALRAGHRPEIYGDGEQSRGFVYVGDVAEANMRAANYEAAAGQVFNVGSDASITINDVLDLLEREAGVRIAPQYLPARAGDVRESLADMSKSLAVLGFRPGTPFAEGIRRTVGYKATGVAVPIAV